MNSRKLSLAVLLALIGLLIGCKCQLNGQEYKRGPECHCGGCEQQPSVRTVAVNNQFTFWVGPGEMYGIDRQETLRLIRKSYRELSSVAAWTWSETDKEHRASVRIYIAGNDHPRLQLRIDGKLYYAFGKASTYGWVYLNRDRKVDYSKKPVLEWLIKHETWHTIWGSAHRDTVGCVMHPGKDTLEFCPAEIRLLRSQIGPPDKAFHPLDRVAAGNMIRSEKNRIKTLQTAWQNLVNARTASIEAGTWLQTQKDLQPQILGLVSQLRDRWNVMAELVKQWHAINNQWRGVPGVVQL